MEEPWFIILDKWTGTESVVEGFFAKKILICPGGVPDAT
jgi:hypothetical protein